MDNLNYFTIGSIVALNFNTARVFQKFGIDFCCRGNLTITEACSAKNLNQEEVETEIISVLNAVGTSSIDYNSWPIDLLADYIEKTHHRYVAERIPEINLFLAKLCKVHGSRHPELFEIYKHFMTSSEELSMHMRKEENVLFPYIRKLVESVRQQVEPEPPHFRTVQNPIAMMMQDHEAEGKRFMEISDLSNNYTPPSDACTTYRVTYQMLKDYEQDLHTHIHLENNILFPKAIEMEQKLQS